MAKKNLAIFFGGRSCEHDVSVITGLQAAQNTDPANYNVIPVYVTREGQWYTGDALREVSFIQNFAPGKATPCMLARGDEGAVLTEWPLRKKGLFGGAQGGLRVPVDVAMPCFHGMNGEDGTIQGMFELMNLPYTSAGVMGSAVGMDKIAQKMLLRGCGQPTLPMCWFDREDWRADREGVLSNVQKDMDKYPLFIKPANLGSSIGITRANDRESLARAIDVAVEFDRRILVEAGIENPMEVNCSALGFGDRVEASVCEMPVAWQEFLTFEDKYMRGGKPGKGEKFSPTIGKQAGGMANLQRKIPAPISEKMTALIQAATVEAFKILDLKGVVRVDYLIDNVSGNFYINEVNTIPGSLAYYLWEPKGLIFARLIDRMVESAFAAQKEKDASKFTYESGVLSGYSGAKS